MVVEDDIQSGYPSGALRTLVQAGTTAAGRPTLAAARLTGTLRGLPLIGAPRTGATVEDRVVTMSAATEHATSRRQG